MRNPVTIESGRTFEREGIEKYFKVLELRAEMAENDSDSNNEVPRHDYQCPITMQRVDPAILVPNIILLKATEWFLSENPWAYNFDPKENYRKINIAAAAQTQ